MCILLKHKDNISYGMFNAIPGLSNASVSVFSYNKSLTNIV